MPLRNDARPEPALFSRARYCWAENTPPSRNQFVSFERRFSLAARPAAPVLLHLFADTRFRLWVNERFVAYGPARFVTGHPEYDTHDLAPHLLPGANLVRVEVNYYGASSFQSMPDGLPGFIADGGSAGLDLATPGEWRARVHRAWSSTAPLYSFAQNPAEICDTRALAAELAAPADHAVVALPPASTPWPKPAPRGAPYPDYATVKPARLLLAAPVQDSIRHGVQLHCPDISSISAHAAKPAVCLATWVRSPRAQSVRVHCFWSKFAVNGAALSIHYPRHSGNQGEVLVPLREGWNFVTASCVLLLERWSWLIEFPADSGVTLHARPDAACQEAFALSPALRAEELLPAPASPAEYVIPSAWTLVSGKLDEITPARLVAWDRPQDSAVANLPFTRLAEADAFTARAALWSFDFGEEYYGHPVVEVEAPAGSVLDVACDDWKRADGRVNLYGSNPFTDAADRFVLRGGRQTVEVLNPRGGIYLQLVLRVPAGSGPAPLRVVDLRVRRRTTLTHRVGHFASDDPLLDWAWNISTRTLQASADESFSDCPWRERGSYIGDCLVNLHLNRLVTADLSVARRTLALFGQAQLPNGQLQGCAPSWLVKAHEDYTLLWVQAVRDYWAHTGDTGFAAAQLPVIRRIFASSTWKADAHGLWDTTGKHPFIDWGVLKSEREGAGNAVVNILRVAALRAAADLASALGLAAEADDHLRQARVVSDALLVHVWDEREGRFRASIGATTPALHANILALRHGVGPADRLLAYLEPLLRRNFRHGIECGQNRGHAELYYFFFILPALTLHGRTDLAEELVREHYGFIRSLGHSTLVECFHRAYEGRGSCCHSWSGAPAIFATDYILGLRLKTPGRPNVWVLDPVVSQNNRAKGAVPHRLGLITAEWELRPDGRILARVSAPSGVTVEPGRHVDILPERALTAIGATAA